MLGWLASLVQSGHLFTHDAGLKAEYMAQTHTPIQVNMICTATNGHSRMETGPAGHGASWPPRTLRDGGGGGSLLLHGVGAAGQRAADVADV